MVTNAIPSVSVGWGFDCNSATSMGIYYANNTSTANSVVNAPASNNGEFALVSLMNNYGFQLFFSGRTAPYMWLRFKDNAWSTWKPFMFG